jgi:putative ABC transport system substrate-binding protein
MHRATLWIVVSATLLVLNLAACASQPKKVVRIGYLAAVSAAADAPRLEAFRQGLRDLGYIEGQNIVIDYRHEARGLSHFLRSRPS